MGQAVDPDPGLERATGIEAAGHVLPEMGVRVHEAGERNQVPAVDPFPRGRGPGGLGLNRDATLHPERSEATRNSGEPRR